jgi:hypothetical protein
MVAYSFKKQFVEPILAKTKRQTVRAGRKRHAHPGEPLQLYTGMRTKQCRLIGRAVCEIVTPITIDQRDHWIYFPMTGVRYTTARDLDFFARLDGFPDWHEMLAFWKKEHPTAIVFSGVLIRWRDFEAPAP